MPYHNPISQNRRILLLARRQLPLDEHTSRFTAIHDTFNFGRNFRRLANCPKHCLRTKVTFACCVFRPNAECVRGVRSKVVNHRNRSIVECGENANVTLVHLTTKKNNYFCDEFLLYLIKIEYRTMGKCACPAAKLHSNVTLLSV